MAYFPQASVLFYIKSVLCFIFGLSTSHVAMSRKHTSKEMILCSCEGMYMFVFDCV